jgi:COP9 signalosome complex subunit 3
MAGIASHLLEFPPEGHLSPGQYDARIRQFIDSLTKIDPTKLLKADQQQDLLQFLDPLRNTVAHLWVLILRYKYFLQTKNPTQNEARALLLLLLNFMQQFDSVQARYVGHMVKEAVDAAISLATHLQQVGHPMVAFIASGKNAS